jgi:hypothetical protein
VIVEIYISTAVALKLSEKHGVTLWFIAETDAGRCLKVVFQRYNSTEYVIKSAYEPNADEERLYQTYKQLR